MDTKIKINIGEYIKFLRLSKNLKSRELARLADITHSAISKVEHNTRKPTPELLQKLSPHLGVSYGKLLCVAGYIPRDFYLISDKDLESIIKMVIKDKNKSFQDIKNKILELY